MYNNLLYFLIAIFSFSMMPPAETSLLPGWASAALFILNLIGYGSLVHYLHNRSNSRSSAAYFKAEQQSSILAIFFFGLAIFLTDLKFYLSILPWNQTLPSLVNIAGLLVFFLYLSIMWWLARPHYQKIFGHQYTTASFILLNIKVNLPIVLPWVLFSLAYDFFAFSSGPDLHALLFSAWGNLLFYFLFLVFVLLIFPPLVRSLWGCVKMPAGPLRDQLTAFCARQHFNADLYLWPLFEGRMLTAGVMGFVPGLRYILITPALIEVLTLEELEAVMAHEIGHVKEKHLLLYLALIAGFSVVIGLWAEPWTYFLLSRDFFYSLISWSGISLETMLLVGIAIPLLTLMLLYFRYLFGYFIRNFERQADLHVFSAISRNPGSSQALVSALEKIALLSGNIRDQPNWHHFGIGERIAYLEKCEQNPQERPRHIHKVWFSLAAYVLAMAAVIVLARQIPLEDLARQYEEKYIEAIVWQKIEQEADKGLWLQLAGDLLLQRKMEDKALDAYERALAFEPVSPDLKNNLAWLLLTSENLQLRDPPRALTLARSAVLLKPLGSFLDTLALAYWANGFTEEAVAAEQEAILTDPLNREYYQQQIHRFQSANY